MENEPKQPEFPSFGETFPSFTYYFSSILYKLESLLKIKLNLISISVRKDFNNKTLSNIFFLKS